MAFWLSGRSSLPAGDVVGEALDGLLTALHRVELAHDMVALGAAWKHQPPDEARLAAFGLERDAQLVVDGLHVLAATVPGEQPRGRVDHVEGDAVLVVATVRS